MFRISNHGVLRLFFLVLLSVTCATAAIAQQERIAAICDSAATLVSRESGVPLDVLRAISLTETGRKSKTGLAPWPWTVNMEGIGKWFEDVTAAQTYVNRHYARGARSFDVGCFQINYKWHGQAFSSIEEMFDPIQNARYAARFLSELHSEFGDWSRAAGAYHSRTPKYARRYIARFDRIRANLPDSRIPPVVRSSDPVPVASAEAPVRKNSYPFLLGARQNAGASLVPLRTSGRALFDGQLSKPLVDRR